MTVKWCIIFLYLLINGTNSDVSGRFSATANMNTENARRTVIPGKQKYIKVYLMHIL